MTERIGTCAFCFQPPWVERMKMHPQPHDRPEVEYQPMLFSCQLLDALEHEPPPPIERRNGTFEIRAGDCESCKHYQPAGGPQLMGVMKKSRARWKAKRKRRRTVEKSRSGATAGGESI